MFYKAGKELYLLMGTDVSSVNEKGAAMLAHYSTNFRKGKLFGAKMVILTAWDDPEVKVFRFARKSDAKDFIYKELHCSKALI